MYSWPCCWACSMNGALVVVRPGGPLVTLAMPAPPARGCCLAAAPSNLAPGGSGRERRPDTIAPPGAGRVVTLGSRLLPPVPPGDDTGPLGGQGDLVLRALGEGRHRSLLRGDYR